MGNVLLAFQQSESLLTVNSPFNSGLHHQCQYAQCYMVNVDLQNSCEIGMHCFFVVHFVQTIYFAFLMTSNCKSSFTSTVDQPTMHLLVELCVMLPNSVTLHLKGCAED